MKSKFQKKKDREKRVKKKLALRREENLKKAKEVKDFEKAEKQALSKPSKELEEVLQKLNMLEEDKKILGII